MHVSIQPATSSCIQDHVYDSPVGAHLIGINGPSALKICDGINSALRAISMSFGDVGDLQFQIIRRLRIILFLGFDTDTRVCALSLRKWLAIGRLAFVCVHLFVFCLEFDSKHSFGLRCCDKTSQSERNLGGGMRCKETQSATTYFKELSTPWQKSD